MGNARSLFLDHKGKLTMTEPTKKRKKPEDPRLRIARENCRMAAAKRNKTNYSDVSRKANMSRNGFGQWVNGDTVISYENMLAVCDELQVPIGLMHIPDAITENKLRLYKALAQMPDHLAERALQVAENHLNGQS
jgi:hypothetical protein